MESDQDALPLRLAGAWQAMREARPLILCITNRVTPQRVADVLLAAGASPMIDDNPSEVEQMAAIASGVYLNTGLHETQVASLEAAAHAINHLDKPAVLAPVGVEATEYRTVRVRRLLESTRLRVVRGNASEIRALSGGDSNTRGVDSIDLSESALGAASALAAPNGLVVAVSGERDLVTDGERIVHVHGGATCGSRSSRARAARLVPSVLPASPPRLTHGSALSPPTPPSPSLQSARRSGRVDREH